KMPERRADMVRNRFIDTRAWLACAALLLATGGRSAAQAPALPLTFGSAESALELRSGTCSVTATLKDAPAGRPVLTADKPPLALESKAAQTGAREVRVLVRLRTDAAPSASASLSLAKKD